jgi:hypothetical protein
MRTLLLLPLLACLPQETKTEPRADTQKALDSIREADLKKHAEFLCADALEGRNAGCPGSVKAGEYIADHFKACGLKPCGDAGTWFQNFEFPVRYFDPRTKPAKQEMAKTRNVVGILEGSDPKLKGETVIVGAHYDHVGMLGQSDAGRDTSRGDREDRIWNGADDNGSGTVTLMELAEAFKESGVKPKRTILFIAFSAEEHGLFGSYWYADHPIFPLDKTSLMINLDMVGRNDEKAVGTHGVGTAKNGELRKVVEEAVKQTSLNANLLDVGDIKKEDSDHYPFYKKEVPAMFFFTDLHADYHQRCDTPDKLAYGNMTKIGRATFLILVDAAVRKERFVFNGPKSLGVKVQGDLSNADAKAAKLADDQGGVVIGDVTPKSVAEAAGIKKGDVILEFNGVKMPRRNPRATLDAELAKVAEKPVKIVLLRNGGRVETKATWK